MAEIIYRTWKEIADRLKVSEATARRWARDFGLPIYQNTPGGRVWTTESDLQQFRPYRWREIKELRPD